MPSFHERFNIAVGTEEARQRFVNRVHNEIFSGFMFRDVQGDDARYRALLWVLTVLGIRCDKPYAQLSHYVGKDFMTNVQAVEALYGYFSQSSQAKSLGRRIEIIMLLSEVDLGVRWTGERFMPAGSELLDEKLVNDVLGVLRDEFIERQG
jgi:hypothetical protein